MEIRQLQGDERFQARLIAAVAFHQRMEDPEKERLESERETDRHWGAFLEDGTLAAHIGKYSKGCCLRHTRTER